MRKLFILALVAIFATNINAQEARGHRADDRKETKDEETEMEIKYFCHELYLDKKEAEHFAKTYREYKKEMNQLKNKYRKRFGKHLNDRQVEKVLHPHAGGHHCKGDKKKK